MIKDLLIQEMRRLEYIINEYDKVKDMNYDDRPHQGVYNMTWQQRKEYDEWIDKYHSIDRYKAEIKQRATIIRKDLIELRKEL